MAAFDTTFANLENYKPGPVENREALDLFHEFFHGKKPREDEYFRCQDRIEELEEKKREYEAEMDRAEDAVNIDAYRDAKQNIAAVMDELEMLNKHCRRLIDTNFGFKY